MLLIGLMIIAIGAFCLSSSYVPISKVKEWSWESFWLVQGVFAWLVFPILGAMLSVPSGHSFFELFAPENSFNICMTVLFGVLWGVGGLTFGLSMRYLGVALGQSISLGTCAALGTILGPVMLAIFYPEAGHLAKLTGSVVTGVAVTLAGIAVIGLAGMRKSREVGDKDGESSVKEFNFPKGIAVALLSGFMSACFNIGLSFGETLTWPETSEIFKTLPATLFVTIGGFVTNVSYCVYQNFRNKSFSGYSKGSVWGNDLVFCALAGLLWYSQFFGLSLGKGFLVGHDTLIIFSFCILMALDIVFSNVWGIILKEWKGCSQKTITILLAGIAILVISCFIPQLLG
ncbi:MAG: rhamnose/proton symporter RhaT [Bacteroidales bacterium]|nr:rhamnose/proton symporter RhaT [Candidatus Cryptobacteroides faecihippi]